ncbi:hypothetical protein BDR26DRAFT_868517 [Obelidium mucronatum]|nr:hypothetical protein BDR26DRAFT_868517 [Obelidium mucronatum]
MTAKELSAWSSTQFTAASLSNAPLTAALEYRELTPESVDRICKPQLAPVWDFLTHRVKSKADAKAIRLALDHAASLPTSRSLQLLSEYKQTRHTALTARQSRIQMRNELKQKIQQTKKLIQIRESSCGECVKSVDDAEIQLNAFRQVIEEKKRKLQLQEAYERDALDFIQVLKEYSSLLTSLLELKTRKKDVSLVGGAIVDEENITKLCDRIERHYFHATPTGEKFDTDTDIILKIQSLVVGTECPQLLNILLQLTRSASELLFEQQKLNHLSHPAANQSVKNPQLNTNSIQRQLHNATRNHILRYGETKALKEETEKILTEMEHYIHVVENQVSSPDDAKVIISHMQAMADHEAYVSVAKALEMYIQNLEDAVRDGKAAAYELKESQEEIARLGKELTRKHGLIASILEANILSRNNIANLNERNGNVAKTRICSLSAPINDIAKGLNGFLAREAQALGTVSLTDEAMTSIRNGGAFLDSVSCPKEVIQELKDALEMPSYLETVRIPDHIRELKERLLFSQRMSVLANVTNDTYNQNITEIVSARSDCDVSKQTGAELLPTFVASVTASSTQYTENMSCLMNQIRTLTTKDAENARLVSADISLLKDRLEARLR